LTFGEKMTSRRKNEGKIKPYKKLGWFWENKRIGSFCPECKAGLYWRNGVHGRKVCLSCGWEEDLSYLTVEKIVGKR